MKQTREQARQVLTGDDPESLINTWNEYSNDQAPPRNLIEGILDLMEKNGEIIPSEDTFKLSELARELNIDPKVARDKYRKAVLKPPSLKTTGWVFSNRDKAKVADIIKLKRNQ